MADEPYFITRLRAEHEELELRRARLDGFITSDEFSPVPGLSNEHRRLLDAQLAVMDAYRHILKARLDDLAKAKETA